MKTAYERELDLALKCDELAGKLLTWKMIAATLGFLFMACVAVLLLVSNGELG